jgi:hypothetical protein
MRRIVVMLTVAALMALMLVVSAMPAFAVANPNASCNGLGGSTETALGGPGARAEIAHEFTGADISFSAHQHSGSVEACFG